MKYNCPVDQPDLFSSFARRNNMKRALFLLMITTLILTACGAAATPVPLQSYAGSPVNGPSAQDSQNAGAPAVGAVTAPESPGSSANPAQDRIVIQNADLTIVVKDPQSKMVEIAALAQRLGGFVVSSNMSQVNLGDNSEVPQGTISIRVPVKDLENALNEIKANTVDVQTENRTGQDVTDKYVDLQSQLKAKQAAADKLYQIMQSTTNATDTLAVFNQLTQVQSDIEVLKGQINYYDQASALSAISVRLVAEQTIHPIVIAGWQPQGVARDALQALIDFFQNFISFLIWLIIFIIPVAAVVIVLMALMWRLLRWFWKKVFPKKTPPVEKTE
jgi:hypothetical protein